MTSSHTRGRPAGVPTGFRHVEQLRDVPVIPFDAIEHGAIVQYVGAVLLQGGRFFFRTDYGRGQAFALWSTRQLRATLPLIAPGSLVLVRYLGMVERDAATHRTKLRFTVALPRDEQWARENAARWQRGALDVERAIAKRAAGVTPEPKRPNE